MSQLPNYYDVLGVSPLATEQEIKHAYRRLVRAYHPDVNPSPSALEQFHRVQEAYTLLTKSDFRLRYDASRPSSKNPKAQASQYQASDQSPPPKPSQSAKAAPPKEPQNDPVNQFFDQFSTLFSRTASQDSPKQSPAKAETQSRAQSQLDYFEGKLLVTPEEIQARKVFKVSAQTRQPCRRCSQTGRVNGKPCAACKGAKRVFQTKEIMVRLPSHVKSSGMVQVEVLQPAGATARLDVTVMTCPSGLRREGSDVVYELALSIPELVLGGVFNCPGLEGGKGFKVTIPACASLEQRLRLAGKGFSFGGKTGDYYVQLRLSMPKRLKKQEQALYRELLHLSDSY